MPGRSVFKFYFFHALSASGVLSIKLYCITQGFSIRSQNFRETAELTIDYYRTNAQYYTLVRKYYNNDYGGNLRMPTNHLRLINMSSELIR